MSNFTKEVANALVHVKIEPRPATDVVIMRVYDSAGDILGTHLTDIDLLGNLSFDINSAIQDREQWLYVQEKNDAD